MNRGVHLVGSVPLGDAEEVFRVVTASVGRHVRRVTDGETGARANRTCWQAGVFARTQGLLADDAGRGEYRTTPKYRLAGDPSAVRFGALGYAAAALSSWVVFRRAAGRGRAAGHPVPGQPAHARGADPVARGHP
ncbi:hypothetical protein [Amycolatopsis sp. FDAARGOS 1241]|uniref:hypothetical protein n=1 Tax=Amycolatopsis sp. FDAARGOS 1241 TaxID=2778070 RepID=UPI00194F2F8D|nr:hypothetical protein [Amycolatopsis sp. FDAARGOS 1241]QRP48217.1 hypothetical protein I6J71_10245 [Amycolatopsis sp. FDAARGOS 1241]